LVGDLDVRYPRRVMGRIAATLALGVLAAASASAHHGLGTFDARREITIAGTIAGLDFVNPHSWLYVDAVDDDGTPRRYRCEMRPSVALRRAGWTPEMFPTGAPITIEASPDRKDPNACYVSTLVFADGTRLDRYGRRAEPSRAAARPDRPLRLASGELNISGDWAEEQTTMTDPRGLSGAFLHVSNAQGLGLGEVPEGRVAVSGTRNAPTRFDRRVKWVRVLYGADTFSGPWNPDPRTSIELTDVGEAAIRARVFGSSIGCERFDLVQHWAWVFGATINRITQGEGTITIEYGHLGQVRTAHMNGAGHPVDVEPSVVGHSIGRWDGDVLVVDTIGFEPGPLLAPYGHGEQLHLVERFSLDPETLALTRDVMAEDPEYFTGDWRFTDVVYPSETPFVVDPCEPRPFEDQVVPEGTSGDDPE
jgi:hypothetical protein